MAWVWREGKGEEWSCGGKWWAKCSTQPGLKSKHKCPFTSWSSTANGWRLERPRRLGVQQVKPLASESTDAIEDTVRATRGGVKSCCVCAKSSSGALVDETVSTREM